MMIRTARQQDLPALLKMSSQLPPGMTSMPFDRGTWEKKLALVEASLAQDLRSDQEAVYLLVLQDPESGEIVGSAGIVAGVGLTRPFYNYKLSKESKYSQQLDLHVTSNLLNLVNDFTGETELISLYLKPEYRQHQGGQFLSRCRYVFMCDFPERFSDIVFAEIRGWLDQSEKSPFWEHLGRKFFNLPFARADFISAVNGSQFISDLMPRFPVYLELLPEAAVEVIGKPHDDALPAMKLLEREGFHYHGTVDIFDAGPVMECDRNSIESIRSCRLCTVAELVDSADEDCPAFIISNRQLPDYRLIMGKVESREDGQIAMLRTDAETLGVTIGSQVQILQLR